MNYCKYDYLLEPADAPKKQPPPLVPTEQIIYGKSELTGSYAWRACAVNSFAQAGIAAIGGMWPIVALGVIAGVMCAVREVKE